MGKRKHKKKRIVKNSGSSRIVLSQKVEDGDEVFDEIDKFHAEYDAKLLKIVKQPKKPLAKEVLRVISDEDFSDDEEGFSDDEESLNNDNQITSNKWGKLRRNYYGTSYVDGDYGGAIHDSDEEEALQLEEQDAIARQIKLENANSCLDFNQFFRKDFELNNSEENAHLGEECGLVDLLQIEVQHPAVTSNSLVGEENEDEIIDESDDDANSENSLSSVSESDVKQENKDDSGRERRKITYEMRKNKGIPKDRGRKKVKRHARIVNRRKFHKALIKKRSQVPDLRREIDRYGGEKRGIRVSTIKSIKF
uniref:Sas10 C-terminal domain-containing protein n=1 Tax=Meloidogyne incognita TaxID=6306 RepID=A0A914MLN7_MELIC